MHKPEQTVTAHLLPVPSLPSFFSAAGNTNERGIILKHALQGRSFFFAGQFPNNIFRVPEG